MLRRLQFAYAFFCVVWAVYALERITSFRIPHTAVALRGAVLCALLLVVIPCSLGYLILFWALPRLRQRRNS